MKQRVIISTNWNPCHAKGILLCWQHLEYIALRRCLDSETRHHSSVTPLKNSIRTVRSFWIPVGLNTSVTLCSHKTLLFNNFLQEENISGTCVGFFSHFCCPVCNQLLKRSDDFGKVSVPGALLLWKWISLTMISVPNKTLNQQNGTGFNETDPLCLLFHWTLVI